LVNSKAIKIQPNRDNYSDFHKILEELSAFSSFADSIYEELVSPFTQIKQQLDQERILLLQTTKYYKNYLVSVASNNHGEEGLECVKNAEPAFDANDETMNNIVDTCTKTNEVELLVVLDEATRIKASSQYDMVTYYTEWSLCESEDCELGVIEKGNNSVNEHQAMVSKLENDITLFKNIQLPAMKQCGMSEYDAFIDEFVKIIESVSACFGSIAKS